MLRTMNHDMKARFRLFRRGWGVYYCEDSQSGKQESLGTSDKHEAQRLVQAKNENEKHPAFSLHLARVYWKAGDPAAGARTWQFVMEEMRKTKYGVTRDRLDTAIDSPLHGQTVQLHSHNRDAASEFRQNALDIDRVAVDSCAVGENKI